MENEFPKQKEDTELKEFTFPANIKQMGSIDKELKIYLEDYVYTYLYQYARSNGGCEKLAVLVGRHFICDGVQVALISGAIEAKHTEYNGEKINFTEESWGHINRQLEMYFKGMCILGWVKIQPDFGTYLMPFEETFHKECFKSPWQTLLIIDPRERVDGFYCYDNEDGIRALRGYFIYYDKNELMQNYMIENSLIKAKSGVEAEEEEKEEETSSKISAVTRLLGMTRNKGIIFATEKGENPERIDAAKKIREVLNKKEELKNHNKKIKQISITTMCLVLCLASVAIGKNIFNTNSKIKSLENQLVAMEKEYRALDKIVEEKTVEVFSQQSEMIKAEVVEVEKAETEIEQINTNYNIYWVEEGDSLWQISKMFYGDGEMMYDIMAVNNIEDENKIYIGEKLIIPRK